MRVLPSLAELWFHTIDRFRPGGRIEPDEGGEYFVRSPRERRTLSEWINWAGESREWLANWFSKAPDLDVSRDVNLGMGMLLALCIWGVIIAVGYELFDLIPESNPP